MLGAPQDPFPTGVHKARGAELGSASLSGALALFAHREEMLSPGGKELKTKMSLLERSEHVLFRRAAHERGAGAVWGVYPAHPSVPSSNAIPLRGFASVFHIWHFPPPYAFSQKTLSLEILRSATGRCL